MPRPAALPAGNAGHAFWASLTHAWTFHATGNTGGADADDIKGSNDATLVSGATLSDTDGLVVATDAAKASITRVSSSDACTYIWRSIQDAADIQGGVCGDTSSANEYIRTGKSDTSIESRSGGGSSISANITTGHRTVLRDYCRTVAAESGSLHSTKLYSKLSTDSTWTLLHTQNDTGLGNRIIDSLGWGLADAFALNGKLHYFYVLDGAELTLANLDDEFADPYSLVESPDSITLTAQDTDNRVRLKKASGTYSWTLAGTFGGSPTAIEWRFGGAGSWTVGDASPTGGTFSFSAAVDGTVGGQGFEVRYANDTDVTASDPLVTVADDVYILAKDSLGSGRLTNEQTHTPRTYATLCYQSTSNAWLEADDNPAINTDGEGSHWPILADRLSDDRIVCYIHNAASGQKLTGYRASSVATLINNSGATGISGVLIHGGANDAAQSESTTDSAAAWQAECEALADSFETAYSGCKTYFAMLGDVEQLTSVDARATAIRQGTLAAVAANANCYLGSNIWWRELTDDHLHPVTDQEGIDFANEWWFSIRSSATARPAFVQATHNEAKTQVTVAFDATLRTGTTLSVECFEVKDDGTPVTISTAAVSGTNVVLTLSSAATGTITVSMGANEGPYGVPPQGTSVALPNSGGSFYPAAEAFFGEAVTEADTTPPAFASAAIPTGGTVVQVPFTEAGSAPLLPEGGVTGFSLSSDGGALSILSACRTSSTVITLAVNRPILGTETVTVSYASGNITDSAPTLNEVADFGPSAITNNSTQTAGGGGGGTVNLIGGGLVH